MSAYRIPRDDFEKAYLKMRQADRLRKCFICMKGKCDSYMSAPVKVHAACAEKRRKEIQSTFFTLQYQNEPKE